MKNKETKGLKKNSKKKKSFERKYIPYILYATIDGIPYAIKRIDEHPGLAGDRVMMLIRHNIPLDGHFHHVTGFLNEKKLFEGTIRWGK